MDHVLLFNDTLCIVAVFSNKNNLDFAGGDKADVFNCSL